MEEFLGDYLAIGETDRQLSYKRKKNSEGRSCRRHKRRGNDPADPVCKEVKQAALNEECTVQCISFFSGILMFMKNISEIDQ
jgi:hypothetical protein